jgi:hypothetical protein
LGRFFSVEPDPVFGENGIRFNAKKPSQGVGLELLQELNLGNPMRET